jgi:hypothetical protein
LDVRNNILGCWINDLEQTNNGLMARLSNVEKGVLVDEISDTDQSTSGPVTTSFRPGVSSTKTALDQSVTTGSRSPKSDNKEASMSAKRSSRASGASQSQPTTASSARLESDTGALLESSGNNGRIRSSNNPAGSCNKGQR